MVECYDELELFRDMIINEFIRLCNYNDYNKLTLLKIGDVVDECFDISIVRCKDCIHRDPEDKKCDCSFQAKGGIFPMNDNDFCSYGERRKNI